MRSLAVNGPCELSKRCSSPASTGAARGWNAGQLALSNVLVVISSKATYCLDVPITPCRPCESVRAQTDGAVRGRLIRMQVLPEEVVHHASGQACAKAKGSGVAVRADARCQERCCFGRHLARLKVATGAVKCAQRRHGGVLHRGQDVLKSVLIWTPFSSANFKPWQAAQIVQSRLKLPWFSI
jgi:hypothetical protein